MAGPQTTEARELSLIDKVEFRIALADSDAKLQTVLNTYLAPLLLKLASEHVSVRNKVSFFSQDSIQRTCILIVAVNLLQALTSHKVISTCQHINTRVKPQNIQLPVAALLKQFTDNPQSPLIRHFDLLYAQQGISRLQHSDQASLLSTLVSGIASSASASAIHGATIFNFMLRSLMHYRLPPKGGKENDELKTSLGVSDEDATFLSFWIGKLLLLRLGQSRAGTTTNCPGVSTDEMAFLTLQGKAETWDTAHESGLNLTEAKIKTLNLLSSGIFNDENRFFPALFASSDPNSRISDSGEQMLKLVLPNVNLQDSTLVTRIFNVYFGWQTQDGGTPDTFVPAVRVPTRAKILNVLSRTVTSTTFPDRVVKLVEQDLLQDFEAFGDASKTDREVAKLRTAVVSFLSFVARTASKAELDAIAQPVIRHLREFVDEEAQDTRSVEVRTLRGQGFVIIGVLAAANPVVLVEPKIELLTWLFQSLREERNKEVVVSIDEALSSVLKSFRNVSDRGIQTRLEDLLLRNMTMNSPNSRNLRYASVRFANRCLGYENIGARWIDLMTVGNSASQSHETVEEAKNGLNPNWHQALLSLDFYGSTGSSKPTVAFPNFVKLVEYIFWDRSDQSNGDISIMALEYCRQALMCQSLITQGIKLDFDGQWDRKLDLAVSGDEETRSAIRREFKTLAKDKQSRLALVTLCNTALTGTLSDQAKVESRIAASRVLVEMYTLLPTSILGQMAPKFASLEEGILANDITIRTWSAQAYGLLSSHPDCAVSDLERSLDGLFSRVKARKEAIGAQLNQVHGSLLALAYFVSRSLYRNPNNAVASQTLQQLLPHILGMLQESSDSLLHDAAFSALGQLSMFSVISPKAIELTTPMDNVIDSVHKWAKNGNETAIFALGYIAMTFDEEKEEELVHKLFDKMCDLHEIRQAETQFAVGEALTIAACGWKSSNMPTRLDIEGPIPQSPTREKSLEPILDRVLNDCAKTTKPALKKASVIWLLSFVQFCGGQPEVQNRLRKLQAVFKRCLSDRDELVQESASRGLGLVYEKGNRELKDDLVRDLVSSFSSNRADTSGSVTEDTQLFEPGALPTGDGSSVSTYKDIMSLASEVGDSSLVYRFMSLASSDAIWSSRAAFGKFGLSNVLSDSSVDGYLASNPKLYPKLYRYRFDPNTKVRRSMNDIWNALVKDSTATVETHFDAIMEDLLSNILGKEWRVREACCAAIADLIQGRKLDKVSPYLDRIWDASFKVLDDIKDSVRRAAADLCRSMSGILIRNLEVSEGSSADSRKMLQSVFPFLFSTSGLESKAKEVQAFALDTLKEIIKKARGATLQPFIPDLVENLLGLLTSLEHQAVNYLYLNASKYNISEQDIDEARLSQIRMSPMMDAIERCLDLLDEETMQKLSGNLQAAMRAAVGMPSKVGCSRVLVSLSTRRSFLFKPYADKFLEVIPKYLADRNETVASSYATALGYVARGASDAAILKAGEVAKSLYFASEDDRSRITSGDIVQAIAKYSTDRFAALASDFLPLVFFARHDESKEVKETYKSIWEENTGGPRAASLYLREIMVLSERYLSSNLWTLKHAAALSIAEVTEAVATTRGNLTLEQSQLIWPALKTALAEKSWEGKERVLDGLVVFARNKPAEFEASKEIAKVRDSLINFMQSENCHAALLGKYAHAGVPTCGSIAVWGISCERRAFGNTTAHRVANWSRVQIGLREAKRRNRVYQSFAIFSLGKIAACADQEELSEDVLEVAGTIVDDYAQGDGETSVSQQRAFTGALDAIFNSFRLGTAADAAKSLGKVSRGLELVAKISAASHFQAPIQSAIYTNINLLLDNFKSLLTADAELLDRQLPGTSFPVDQLAVLLFSPDDAMAQAPEAVRLKRSEAILAFAGVCKLLASGEAPPQALALSVLDERSQQARQNLQEALHIFQSLRH